MREAPHSHSILAAPFAPRLKSFFVGAAGLFLLCAFASFQPSDLGLFSSSPNVPLRNIGGVVGAWIALVGRGGFGWAGFVLPLLCGVWAAQLWEGRFGEARWITRTCAGLCLLTSLGTLLALAAREATWQTQLGGAIGYVLVREGRYYLGAMGTGLLAACVAGLSWFLVADQVLFQSYLTALITRIGQTVGHLRLSLSRRSATAPDLDEAAVLASRGHDAPRALKADQPLGISLPAAPSPAKLRSTVVPKPKTLPTPAPAAAARQTSGGFQLPSLDLLTTPPPASQRQLTEDLPLNAKILEETLRDFGIEATCVNVDRGPTVTRYELAPAPGMKITKIVSLSDDIALVLKAVSCHIVAPIPGKGLVGVEVPNSSSTMVYLKEVLAANEFSQTRSPLTLAIGKDVSGQPVVVDLRACPHLLIAGATGSGKTVCLNSILTGILCHATPDEVKFLMIDPKMVELALFNNIPHLVAPVVTESKRAAPALAWAVSEMERRYQVLAKTGVRNIEMYNQRLARMSTDGTNGQVDDPEAAPPEPLPYLVIVIDELADLMLVASRDVEEAITRLSQMSRAVGLHVILATQRPSVDVITGVIKANFPARLAFQVASKVDSRTILDVNGADKLLGRGDLMFLQPGTAKPIRAQGCLVTDEEIERVVDHLKAQRPPVYHEQLLATHEKSCADAMLLEKDELYELAKKLVLNTGQASTSLLQRRLRLGYGRAARMLDLMEQEGLIGPPQGSRPREILVNEEASRGDG